MIATSRQRERAAEVCEMICDDLAAPPPLHPNIGFGPRSPRWRDQSLSKGAAGIAVLHGIRAQDGHPHDGRVHGWLTAATRDDLSAAPGSGLWFGAPSVAYALIMAAPGKYRSALSTLDASLHSTIEARIAHANDRVGRAATPTAGEFDLVRGLTGLGAYLLHRDPDGTLIRDILNYLVQLHQPLPATGTHTQRPGWWTHDQPKDARPEYADGHANLGMAHGISGPLAFLSLAMRKGIHVPGHAETIDALSRWIERWRQDSATGAWWPERLTLHELQSGRTRQQRPARPSWCYGTPGVARALQLAGLALSDHTRQSAAEDALIRCLADPAQLATITDLSLCHGWAGLVATCAAAARDALSDRIAACLHTPISTLIDAAEVAATETAPGLIDGRAGAALTLHHLTAGTTTRWQTCLLIN